MTPLISSDPGRCNHIPISPSIFELWQPGTSEGTKKFIHQSPFSNLYSLAVTTGAGLGYLQKGPCSRGAPALLYIFTDSTCSLHLELLFSLRLHLLLCSEARYHTRADGSYIYLDSRPLCRLVHPLSVSLFYIDMNPPTVRAACFPTVSSLTDQSLRNLIALSPLVRGNRTRKWLEIMLQKPDILLATTLEVICEPLPLSHLACRILSVRPVYEYPLRGQWIMMDIDDGYILWTGIWKGTPHRRLVHTIPDPPPS